MSKTGVSDESILLDTAFLRYLGPALQHFKAGGPLQPLFACSYADVLKAWKQSLVILGLSPDLAVMYQLRHPLRGFLGQIQETEVVAGD